MIVFLSIFVGCDGKERLLEMRRLLSDELPDDNYYVLKFVIHFLTEVCTAKTYCYFILFQRHRK